MSTDDGNVQAVSRSRQTADRVIAHFKRSFDNYLDHWQEWIVPMLIAGLVLLAAYLCCILPYLFVMGPLTCGLYHCAFEAHSNRVVRTEVLNRGMESAGSSMLAFLLIVFINALPALLVGVGYVVIMMAMMVAAVPPGPNQGEPPPELMMGFFGMYLIMLVAMIPMLIWQLWFSTRTMFVLPLIAHRQMGVSAAWSASWRETRSAFWELLVLNLAAQTIAMMGAYFMYVGMLFTVPFAITLKTSVYLERFGKDPTAGSDQSGNNLLDDA